MTDSENKEPEFKSRLTSDAVRGWIQLALLVFAAIFGVYQFWYKEEFVPSQRPASLAISGELEEVGRKGGTSLIRARVRAENKRDVRIYAPALWYTVTGVRLVAKNTESLAPPSGSPDNIDERYAFHSVMKAVKVVATWRVPSWETWYDPGDATTNEELFYVPLDVYDALELKIEVNVMRKMDCIAPPVWHVLKDGSLSPATMIKKPNFELDSTQTERFAPDAIAGHRKLERRIGMAQNWSVTTLSLWPSAKK